MSIGERRACRLVSRTEAGEDRQLPSAALAHLSIVKTQDTRNCDNLCVSHERSDLAGERGIGDNFFGERLPVNDSADGVWEG
jgi:hypothetical protein